MFPSRVLLLPATRLLLLSLGRWRAAQRHQRCRQSVAVAGTSLGIFIFTKNSPIITVDDMTIGFNLKIMTRPPN